MKCVANHFNANRTTERYMKVLASKIEYVVRTSPGTPSENTSLQGI